MSGFEFFLLLTLAYSGMRRPSSFEPVVDDVIEIIFVVPRDTGFSGTSSFVEVVGMLVVVNVVLLDMAGVPVVVTVVVAADVAESVVVVVAVVLVCSV